MSDENIPHVQAKFFTKQPQYSVPDTPYSVPASVGATELSALICQVLKAGSDESAETAIDFDFLLDGEFLRLPLDKHLENKGISSEDLVEIEFIERQPAPKPEDSLLHDDWVSCLQGCQECILSGCYDNTVRLWSTTGVPLLTIPGHSAPVKCVRWLNGDDGPICRFITGSHDQTILIWEWHKQDNSVECVHACRGHGGSVDCIAINDEKDKFVSGSWDKMLKLWSAASVAEGDQQDTAEAPSKKQKISKKVQTRVPILTLSGHTEGISAAEWLGRSEVCTASWDHTLRLWDMEKATQTSQMQGTKVFLDMSYSHLNRQIVTASADRHLRLWDPRTSDGAIVKCTYTSHNGWVSSVSWSPVNQYLFLSGSYDAVMKLWDTRSPKAPLYNMSGHEEKILSVDWSIPSLLLSGAADNHLKIFHYKDTQYSKGR
ncbi:ribosome biogenesis protein WDR12 homolog isoform X1 [Ostrea edulis]|uniref:ribosome biogenesis protein WDR12 homolog isoform X1 n=1 Tax=Ostrea edulis TaxID=37623 RepID=UPI002094B5C7|nr:ribosome biogenesis protein WDR12 homolog isoform X1 [Ostrea edulis]